MHPLNRRLFEAAREGRASQLRELVEEGADPNCVDPGDANWGAYFTNLTPLMVAAGSPRSNAETVSELLALGADVQLESGGGTTAGWYAAGGTGFCLATTDWDLPPDHPYQDWGGGDVERLRILLDAGAHPSETASNGRSDVCEAASAGDPERLRLLLDRGANVWPASATRRPRGLKNWLMRKLIRASGVDPDSWNFGVPLFLAADSGNLECVRLILQEGFPADFATGDRNALHYARTAEIARILIDAGAQVETDAFNDPVDEAFQNNRFEVAEVLLAQIPEPRREAYYIQKLMNVVGVNMNPDAVRMMLRLGVDVNVVDSGLGTPLHYAAWQGDGNGGRANSVVRETLELLISAGADVNRNLPDRGAPLHEAVAGDWESPTSTRVLLEHGADPEATDARGDTPLILAIEMDSLECARLLLAAGADPNRVAPSGRSPKQEAKRRLVEWRELAAKESPREESATDPLDALTSAEAVERLS